MMVSPQRKRYLLILLFIITASGIAAGMVWQLRTGHRMALLAGLLDAPVKVGVLHAVSGPLSAIEQSVIDAILLAIEEINHQGGVLERPIVPIVVDTQSDERIAAQAAERLIVEDSVVSIFGCWTSACRKTVKPVFERHHHLLIYPAPYEGFETSPNIIYTGTTPNQSLLPAVQWSFDNLGRRFYLIGSDYVFPRMAHEIFKEHITAIGGEVAGEDYLLPDDLDVSAAVTRIIAARPDVILNTLTGNSNIAFLAELRARDKTLRAMHFGLTEEDIAMLGADLLVNDYAALSYFQSIDSDDNTRFVQRFKRRYGANRVTSEAIEAAYASVYLWVQAVNQVQTDDVDAIRANFGLQTFASPQGWITIDPGNQHTWKTARIGRIQSTGQFEIVWSSVEPVRPLPYLASRSQRQWQQQLNQLYIGWGKRWSNHGSGS
jgi:urea transport system substrate-binding protein